MLANMADLIVAADDAWFWDSVLFSMGLAATEVLFQPWVMGLRHAKEFLFTGERITAEQAYRVGMVNRVVAREALDDATLAIAERIAQAPPFAMRALKKSLNRTYDIQGSAMRCKRISILIRSLTRRRSSLKSGISACRRSSRTTRPIRGAQCISLSTP